MDKEAAKQAIVDFINSKSKSKSKFYFNDFTQVLPDMKTREVKKLLTQLITKVCWNSGPVVVLPCMVWLVLENSMLLRVRNSLSA